jgi:Zn-dependent protease
MEDDRIPEADDQRSASHRGRAARRPRVSASSCARCHTELSPYALVCPACATLRHADQLKALAADAEAAQRAGHVDAAREHWSNALALLPPDSQQYRQVQLQIANLDHHDAPHDPARPTGPERSWWRRGLAGVATAVVLLAGKLKFLLLGLTKMSTFASMFAFFGVYWSLYGWPLALGLVLSIYIHEMGHVAMLRRLGIAAGAPLFIPGVGAEVMLKQHIADPSIDARIGLAGPVWGLGAALAALGAYEVSQSHIWYAIAELTAFINLFNLIPIWQLDGSRGFHALDRAQRWTIVAVVAVALLLTGQSMLFLIGGVAVWRALQRDSGPGDVRATATFAVLVLALAAIARTVR